ncbi:MAG: phosphate ABC transporter permease PstA [Planctomycetaceae bacterium]|nr:phosphate ABC transporter permease PstA [Planctomycetaceae bacterium]
MRLSPALRQKAVVTGLWTLAALTVAVLLFIVVYVLAKGLPHVTWNFLTDRPREMGKAGGILPMIVGTLAVTALAVLIAAPVGVVTAIFLTEYTREGKLTAVIRFGADCLAGIPSIIFGLFGFVFFAITLKMGLSILAGGLTLAIMVLPTIIRTSEEAIRAVPAAYREVSLGLGATRWQTVTNVVLRSALPGISTGIVLSIGRSVSETAALILTAGSALRMPQSLMESSRTLSVHFYILSREGISMDNAYATAAILIVAILLINIAAYWLMSRFIAKAS